MSDLYRLKISKKDADDFEGWQMMILRGVMESVEPDLDAMRRVLVNEPDDDRFYSFYFHDEQLLTAFRAALGITNDE